jgi:hypothetical protein
VKKATLAILEKAESLPTTHLNKSYLLFILQFLLKYKSLNLANNQTSVLKLLVSDEFKTLHIKIEDSSIEDLLFSKGRSQVLVKEIKNINMRKVLVMPNEICYLVAFLDLLSGCCQSRTSTTENICQNMLSLE